MPHDFDRIADLQGKLAKLPCQSCQAPRLALVLRCDADNETCEYSAFCQTCQKKYSIDADTGCLFDAPTFNPPENCGHGMMLWQAIFELNVFVGCGAFHSGRCLPEQTGDDSMSLSQVKTANPYMRH